VTSDRSALRVELVPDLSHCIETVARRAYDDSLGQYFQSEGENRQLEERIELLRLFLESMDFAALRRASEAHLMAGKVVKFIVYLEGSSPGYRMEIIPSQ